MNNKIEPLTKGQRRDETICDLCAQCKNHIKEGDREIKNQVALNVFFVKTLSFIVTVFRTLLLVETVFSKNKLIVPNIDDANHGMCRLGKNLLF